MLVKLGTSRQGIRWVACSGVIFFLACPARAHSQTVAYEGTTWPESAAWSRNVFCDPPRQLNEGWFELQVNPCPGDPLPGGQQDTYNYSLADFVGIETFFLEWRAVTTGPSSEILGVAPASVVAGGNFGTNYHFTFANDEIRMIRDTALPILNILFDPGVAHLIRLELYSETTYMLYIDGILVDEGVPEGPYPQNDSAVISFRTKCWYEPNITNWDYLRFGVIPEDASGDFDSDGIVALTDFYLFHECLTNNRIGIAGGPENDSGPGCQFADFDTDGDTDLSDFAEFENLFSGND